MVHTANLLSARAAIEARLPEFVRERRWFGGKARAIARAEIADAVACVGARFVLARIVYQDGGQEMYSVPLVEVENVAAVPRNSAGEPAPHFDVGAHGPVFYDAIACREFLDSLLKAIRDQGTFPGEAGELRARHTTALRQLMPAAMALPPKPMRAEQSNSSVAYGDRLMLKLFRRAESGLNPDLEIGRFLTERTAFRNVPPLAGYLEYASEKGEPISLGVLQGFVANRGDAWEFTLQAVRRLLARAEEINAAPQDASRLMKLPPVVPLAAERVAGDYLPWARRLGQRTAEMHLALAQGGEPAFDPEPFTAAERAALCESVRELMQRNFKMLREQAASLPPEAQAEARVVLGAAGEFEVSLQSLASRDLSALRTRIHGDYHLGQVLVTGDDFVITDFEGEPARPLEQRRRKRSPLQDVAGMLRSFHYAAYAPLLAADAPAGHASTAALAGAWQVSVSAAFLQAYLQATAGAAFLPQAQEEWSALLQMHLLEKAVYELGYELNNRPAWVRIPLSGIAQLATKEGR